ncbi:MAG: hypothetical protein CMO40_08495 [Verrucomicrobiaceae bacterium]|nr:hypothetical protein [Verrucomicrobiaceae bacterium]
MQTQAGEIAMLEGTISPEIGLSATDPTCLDQTSELLLEHGLASPDEIQQLRQHGRAVLRGSRQWDSIEFLAALRMQDSDARLLEIERLGRMLSQAMESQLALVPFAGRLPTPSAFYDHNENLRADCKRLMTPVLYSEESEVIGIGSINPVALRLASQTIMHSVGERMGTIPMVSRMLLHHDGWISLCQKHFGI